MNRTSGEYGVNHLAVNVGGAISAALVLEGHPLAVDVQNVQWRRQQARSVDAALSEPPREQELAGQIPGLRLSSPWSKMWSARRL